jgi:hypothetical protein
MVLHSQQTGFMIPRHARLQGVRVLVCLVGAPFLFDLGKKTDEIDH